MKDKINCKWLLKLEIKPTLSHSEEISDYNFKVIGNKTFVEIKYETNSFDEKLQNDKNDYEYAEKILANKFINEIHNLLLIRMVYHEVNEKVDIKVIEGPKLLNAEELREAGNKLGRKGSSTAQCQVTILTKEDTLSSSQDFWRNGFQNKINGKEEDLLRIVDWFQRAERENDYTKKFVLYWIGFNGLYGLLSQVDNKAYYNDAAKIDYFIKNLLCNKSDRIVNHNLSSLDSLESYNIKSANGNKNWSNALKTERNKQNHNYRLILKYAMKCIYGIRKEIFHEAPKPLDIEDHIKNSIPLLSMVCSNGSFEMVNY